MILIDTSLYIEAVEKDDVRKILENIAKKNFVLSCNPIEKEIHDASEFLRKRNKRKDSEELKLIYNEVKQGVVELTERIRKLRDQYLETADHLSKNQYKDIKNDLLIVASASVAGVKTILSFNRKTMASEYMIKVYNKVNKLNGYDTLLFFTKIEDLSKFL